MPGRSRSSSVSLVGLCLMDKDGDPLIRHKSELCALPLKTKEGKSESI